MATKDCVVFTGPSLACHEVESIDTRLTCRPPAARGDISKAARAGARFVGLIDGVFYDRAAVSHREIIDAMRSRVTIVGGGSMGALRASELDGFGMIGVGRIYSCFKKGIIEADDEVAVGYNPVTFEPISDPLVNIRVAMHLLSEAQLLDRSVSDALIGLAQDMFYLDRSVPRLLKIAQRGGLITEDKGAAIRVYLAGCDYDLKKADAQAVVRTMVRLRYGES